MSKGWIKALFLIAGIYDIACGGVMFFASGHAFQLAGGVAPDPGYIQFPALLVALFGIMFLRIAANPVAARELILYGMGLKACYCGVVFWYLVRGTVPFLFVPLAWTDAAFFVLFFAAWRALAPRS